MYDLIIKGGRIIDGTGNPHYFADIGIKDGVITAIGHGLCDSKEIIDAKGLTVTPGFIDSHSHSDTQLVSYPDQKEKPEQGITTCIGGMCGGSTVPKPTTDGFDKTVRTFRDKLEGESFGMNMALFVGHGNIRGAVLGMSDKAASAEEIEKMKGILREAMENGALGMSLGLLYAPGCYSTTEELVELARVVHEYGGLISAHLRDEGDALVKSVDEFLTVVRASGVRGVISHHKAMKRDNFGKVAYTLRLIDEANEDGYEVYCDVYPYTASHTSLAARFIPKQYRANGMLKKNLENPEIREKITNYNLDVWGVYGRDLSWVQVCSCDAYPQYKGMKIPEIAKIHGKSQFDTIYDMIANSKHCECCFFMMCEEDVERVLKHPRSMICTDSNVAGSSTVYHPRLIGSFPRVLGRYVRERGVTALPEMIRKMTSLPATVYGLKKKGLLIEGYDADICIFDAEKIIDRAEFDDCTKGAEGLNYVIIGGETVVRDANYNGIRKGKLIFKGKRGTIL